MPVYNIWGEYFFYMRAYIYAVAPIKISSLEGKNCMCSREKIFRKKI